MLDIAGRYVVTKDNVASIQRLNEPQRSLETLVDTITQRSAELPD